jgi:hypothetical protein
MRLHTYCIPYTVAMYLINEVIYQIHEANYLYREAYSIT